MSSILDDLRFQGQVLMLAYERMPNSVSSAQIQSEHEGVTDEYIERQLAILHRKGYITTYTTTVNGALVHMVDFTAQGCEAAEDTLLRKHYGTDYEKYVQ